MTIAQQLKNAAVGGSISIEKALNIASGVDAERESTVKLFRELETQVGMHHGEKINAHLADMEGTYFNERDYHYEKPVGEQ